MSKHIAIRNKLRDLVQGLDGFGAQRVALYKLDNVDKLPFVGIYLNETNTENLHMMRECATMERVLTVNVDIHLAESVDADLKADNILETLEKQVLKAAKNGEIDGVRMVFLQSAEFRPTERGKERSGDLVTTWAAEYDDSIDLT